MPHTYKVCLPNLVIDCADSGVFPAQVGGISLWISFEADSYEDAKTKIAQMFSNSALLATSSEFEGG